MENYLNKQKYIINIKKILKTIFTNIDLLSPMISVKGLRDKLIDVVGEMLEYMSDDSNGYDDLYDYSRLYAYVTDNYVAFNYYEYVNALKKQNGEKEIVSLGMKALYWDLNTNQIYFFNKVHSADYDIDNEGNFLEFLDGDYMSYSIDKYYLENEKPVVSLNSWDYVPSNYHKKDNNPALRLIDAIVSSNNNNDQIITNAVDRIEKTVLKYH